MRQIYTVNATQTVTSDTHPEGLYSVISGYPKTFDSLTYPASDGNPNGDEGKALRMARGEYLSRLAAIVTADNPTRAMATVTLMRADGRIVMAESIGQFPDMTPKPEAEEEVNENG